MITDVRVVGHGRPAAEALAEVVVGAKSAGALAPVTVIVPTNLVGLAARRRLGGTGPGVANVNFVTPFRLAELLAGDLLHDRRPVTNPVLGAAVRRALAETAGPFAEVAAHYATETAFAALYTELAHVSEATLVALERAGGPAALAVAVYREVASLLDGFHGEDDVVRAAARRPDLATQLGPLGHIVWYLPEPLTPGLTQLLKVVLDEAPGSVMAALTGVTEADAPVRSVCARAGIDLPEFAAEPPVAATIVSVTDADEEVRAVVRRIVELAEAGVALDRIGVFHPTPDPYTRTLAQQFAAARIPANGPARERLADSVAGRTLLAALALPAQRWRRDRVMALLSGAPLHHRDQRVHPAVWEELSRTAGVVQDLSDWKGKLAALGAAIERQITALGPDAEEWRIVRRRRHRDDVEALAWFIDDLAAAVDDVDLARGWRAKTEAARLLLRQVLGAEHRRLDWTERELDAAARVEDALTRLGNLDEIEPEPSTAVFRRAVTAELDVTRGRSGRFGEGVIYGPLAGAVGHDLDAVFILGMAEGQCPAPRRDDALLPDTARLLAADGELATGPSRMPDQHRAFLAALAAAPPDRRVLVYPRGDLRGGRHRLPSRWLLDSASALAKEPVYSTDFPKLVAPVVDIVPSYAAGVRRAAVPASVLDRDLAAVAQHVGSGGVLAEHPATAPLRRGFECVAARRSPAYTEWDGNLTGLPVPSPASGKLLSATGLQDWSACGFRYLLGHVFGLAGRDDPERIIALGALDRGSAVHKILERFFDEVLEGGVPDPDTPWSEAQRARLGDIADEVFADLEQTGRTGRPLHWRLERRQLAAVVDTFLTHDEEYRRSSRSRPLRVELPFGTDTAQPVHITVPDGRTIPFKGFADRVDVADDGRHYVSDYKTGRGSAYDKIDQGDPTRAGTTLQLGLYAEAAVQLLGAASAAAHYWMVDEAAGFSRKGYAWDGPRRARFVEVVGAIVTGIETGIFPAVPGEWDSWRHTNENCRYCAFDDVCPRDRGEFAEAKEQAPELRIREVLLPAAEEES